MPCVGDVIRRKGSGSFHRAGRVVYSTGLGARYAPRSRPAQRSIQQECRRSGGRTHEADVPRFRMATSPARGSVRPGEVCRVGRALPAGWPDPSARGPPWCSLAVRALPTVATPLPMELPHVQASCRAGHRCPAVVPACAVLARGRCPRFSRKPGEAARCGGGAWLADRADPARRRRRAFQRGIRPGATDGLGSRGRRRSSRAGSSTSPCPST